jgi:hypothetical protein
VVRPAGHDSCCPILVPARTCTQPAAASAAAAPFAGAAGPGAASLSALCPARGGARLTREMETSCRYCSAQEKQDLGISGSQVCARRVCSTAGSWQQPLPGCVGRVCEPLAAPAHGALSNGPTNGARYPSVASYSCSLGYQLVGPSTRSCTARPGGGKTTGSFPQKHDFTMVPAPKSGV